MIVVSYMRNFLYVFTQPLHQGQCVITVALVWIQSFPSPRPVTLPKLKSSVNPTIYPLLDGGRVDRFMPF